MYNETCSGSLLLYKNQESRCYFGSICGVVFSLCRLTPNTAMASRMILTQDMARKVTFSPCIPAFAPYAAAERFATAVMIPTNTAEPMAPEMVRKEVKSAVAWAVFDVSMPLVPQVMMGIIRQPMETQRTTL